MHAAAVLLAIAGDANAEAGVVPLDGQFPSGADAPPDHPNCVCDVLPVLVDEKDLEE